jgi:hypothetical protein
MPRSVLVEGWYWAWCFLESPILSLPIYLCTIAVFSNENVWGWYSKLHCSLLSSGEATAQSPWHPFRTHLFSSSSPRGWLHELFHDRPVSCCTSPEVAPILLDHTRRRDSPLLACRLLQVPFSHFCFCYKSLPHVRRQYCGRYCFATDRSWSAVNITSWGAFLP